jgi:methionine-rich copper-binding protein CopC
MKNISLVIIGIKIIISLSTIFYLVPIEVYGHANPVRYIPPSNSVFQLDQLLPTNITILYSERPEQKVSYIHVLNSQNERIDNNNFKITGQDERGGSVTLDSTKLSSGTYTISWLVLSKDDGHITKGSYVFSITDTTSSTNTTTNTTTNETKTFIEKTTINKVNLEYEITPLIAGINIFTVTLKDEEMNKPIGNVKNVIMQFTNQDKSIGPIIANLKNIENGVYTTTGAYLSQAGEWNVKTTVQRTGEYDLNHNFDIAVPAK